MKQCTLTLQASIYFLVAKNILDAIIYPIIFIAFGRYLKGRLTFRLGFGGFGRGNLMNILKEWNGGSHRKQDSELWKVRPAYGFIITPQDWSILWKAWQGNAELPEVNFKQELLLVAAGSGPNFIRLLDLSLDSMGELTFFWGVTQKGGDGFVYRIFLINREGIRTVNGRSIYPINRRRSR